MTICPCLADGGIFDLVGMRGRQVRLGISRLVPFGETVEL
jgi:hypothetical protein